MADKNLVIYIHGKGGLAKEAERYASLFADSEVIGFDYKSQTPWQATDEFSRYYDRVSQGFDNVYLVANSIGAFFAVCGLADKKIKKAYFISPIADMEELISSMMMWAGINEETLQREKEIATEFGETLSWDYLKWVRTHPASWKIPTEILYGEKDNMQSFDAISRFSKQNNAGVTVMKDGEHWFHTEEQMSFLEDWLKEKTQKYT